LQALLATLTPTTVVQGDEMDFSPPHERALAHAMQLPDTPGLIPWAALASGETTQPCAFITPCHWHITPDQVHQTDPASAPLSEDESRQLLALIAPWFSDDGITLEYLRPDLWLARGAAFKDLATASMDRALGRDVRPWMPNPIQGAIIQRLQSAACRPSTPSGCMARAVCPACPQPNHRLSALTTCATRPCKVMCKAGKKPGRRWTAA
ncbi:MAG: hypothetical protein RR701_18795, partial [Comamonas sp.]